MKQNWIKLAMFAFAIALLVPAASIGQDEQKAKEKETKDKEIKEIKKDGEQIIITRRGDKDQKVTIEINGDKVTVNGKPLDEYQNDENGVSVRRNKLRSLDRTPYSGNGNWNVLDNGNNGMTVFGGGANHAMLGVVTEKAEKGVSIQDITKESAAAKAGLKEGDVITKIDDTKIEDPDDLSTAIQKHKPGEKVNVTYLRDNKESKASAELTEWKGSNVFNMKDGQNFKFDMGDMDFNKAMPKISTMPRGNNGLFWVNSGPKLGLSVQDTDDGKGVKVIEVDGESMSEKAGVKKDDVITEVDGKAVNGTDDISKIIRESKDKPSIMLKLNRAGKTQNIEVKMPRKIKTTDI